MASRRGLNNAERLATNIVTVSATGAVFAAPCYLYEATIKVDDSTTTALCTLSDTTAAGDANKESATWRIKVGTAGASGNTNFVPQMKFQPPVYIQNQLFWAFSTGVTTVSVSYLPAS